MHKLSRKNGAKDKETVTIHSLHCKVLVTCQKEVKNFEIKSISHDVIIIISQIPDIKEMSSVWPHLTPWRATRSIH